MERANPADEDQGDLDTTKLGWVWGLRVAS